MILKDSKYFLALIFKYFIISKDILSFPGDDLLQESNADSNSIMVKGKLYISSLSVSKFNMIFSALISFERK